VNESFGGLVKKTIFKSPIIRKMKHQKPISPIAYTSTLF